MQAHLAVLTDAIAREKITGTTTGGAPDGVRPADTTTLPATTQLPVPPTAPSDTTRPPTVPALDTGPSKYIKLANGVTLCFSKQSIPDPPSISFAKDIPHLMRVWDDSYPEWSPAEAILHIGGEPIALKYWHDLYCYGKSGQWRGTKKSWAHWRVRVCSVFLPWQDAYCLTCLGHR
jgi:hypothetical protein